MYFDAKVVRSLELDAHFALETVAIGDVEPRKDGRRAVDLSFVVDKNLCFGLADEALDIGYPHREAVNAIREERGVPFQFNRGTGVQRDCTVAGIQAVNE